MVRAARAVQLSASRYGVHPRARGKGSIAAEHENPSLIHPQPHFHPDSPDHTDQDGNDPLVTRNLPRLRHLLIQEIGYSSLPFSCIGVPEAILPVQSASIQSIDAGPTAG
jgi:hypothetical protein